jgi:hypothetical protein
LCFTSSRPSPFYSQRRATQRVKIEPMWD